MGKGDGNIDVTMRMREEGVVRTSAQFVRYMKEADTHAQNLARSSRRAGKAVKDAGKDGADGMGKLASSARTAMFAITGIGSATGVIYAVKRAIRSLVEEYQKIPEIQAKMQGALLGSQEHFQRTAALPVYAGDLERVTEQGINIALKTKASMDIVGESMFYTTSALSHLPEKQRLAAAEEMTRFGTVHQMTSEEMSGLPQLWKVEGAETAKEMRDVMNKLYVGVGESIAEFGEALKHFPRMRAVQKQYGFSLEESLSMYTGALDIMNASKAGQTSMIAAELGIGRTKKGLQYLRRVARDQGIANFVALSPPERSTVLGEHIKQLVEKKDWGGVTKFFMAMGGGRGSGRMAFMQYSDTARAKMESTRARLEGSRGQDLLGGVYTAYERTPGARQRLETNRRFARQYIAGKEDEYAALSYQVRDDFLDAMRRNSTWQQKLGISLLTEEMVDKFGLESIVRGSLLAIQPGDDRYDYKKAQRLRAEKPAVLGTHPEYLKEVYDVTKGFTSLRHAPIKDWTGVDMEGLSREERYRRKTHETWGPVIEAMFPELITLTREQIEILKAIEAATGKYVDVPGRPGWPPYTEVRSGNTDQ